MPKVVGIIGEYNPFHNGHAYHLAKTKRETKADYAIVVYLVILFSAEMFL